MNFHLVAAARCALVRQIIDVKHAQCAIFKLQHHIRNIVGGLIGLAVGVEGCPLPQIPKLAAYLGDRAKKQIGKVEQM
jgi:hypothetical protein